MTKKSQTVHVNRFRIQFDLGYKGHEGKEMDMETMTQPDMSLTVRQLLENHTRGKDSNVQHREPLYFDIEIPQISDMTDVVEFRNQLERKLQQTNEFIEREKNQETEEQSGKPTKVIPIQTDLTDQIKEAEKSETSE
jgi:hypothetical protein